MAQSWEGWNACSNRFEHWKKQPCDLGFLSSKKKKKGFDLPAFDRDLEDQGLTFAVSFSTIGKQCVAVS